MKLERILLILLIAVAAAAPAAAQDGKQLQEERDTARYYDKWLNEDVLYILTEQERDVFQKLTTAEEKDRFIEQFWQRRDPDPSTAANEAREEHYRRIAFVNQHFGSGIPGWKTDRGRIYVMFGEPDQKEYYAGMGTHVRPSYEGGGRTATFPFEIWRYRWLEGVGEDIEIEFVDRSMTGEFKIAVWPWEKDMLLHVDGLGETTAERFGRALRSQRPGLHPGNLNNMTWMKRHMGVRNKDLAFERVRQFFALQRPPKIERKELQEIVETKVSYEVLPFDVFVHDVRLNEDQALVPVTIQIANQNLDYQPAAGNLFKARVGIYGRVTSMLGKVVHEFEDTIASEYRSQHIGVGSQLKSLYQKSFLVAPGRYKLDLVVKDLTSGDLGTRRMSFHVSGAAEEGLSASSIVLAETVQTLDELPETPQSFVIGDVRVVPKVSGKFRRDEDLGVYLQVYNPGLDQATETPDVEVEYTITDGETLVGKVTDPQGSSVVYASEQRLVLVQNLPLSRLEKGRYRLTVTVNDRVTGQTSHSEADFEVLG